VQIGAVRGGNAHAMGAGSEVCSLYVEINLTPVRIPAVKMGPTRWRPSIDDLVACANVYALAALGVCRRLQ
jgi:hypothetical protein